MQNDLVDVLRNPLRFARIKARNMLDDPLAIPGKTLSYAKYDVVRVLNSLMEALRLDQSSFERLVAKVMSVPARRFMRSRRVSFLAGLGRRPLLRPASCAAPTRARSWCSGSPPNARNAASTSRSSSSRRPVLSDPALANVPRCLLV